MHCLTLTTLFCTLLVDSMAFLGRENATVSFHLGEKSDRIDVMREFGRKEHTYLRNPVPSDGSLSTSHAIETKALLDLFSELGGDAWKNNYGWAEMQFLRAALPYNGKISDLKKPLCAWHGVTCADGSTTDDNGMTDLDLSHNNLVGTVNLSHLWKIPTLRTINLTGNSIHRVSFGDMGMRQAFIAPIESLLLSENNLAYLDDDLKKATTLKDLQVDSNKLLGTFPEEVLALTNLEKLSLSFNHLTGPIPTTLTKLTVLRELSLNGNNFHGSLPTCIAGLTNLKK